MTKNRYFGYMKVSASELANDSKMVLDRVIRTGEIAEIQRHGKTVAEIRPKFGATRSELIALLRGRGFSEKDTRELKRSMDDAADVFGYAGGD